MPEITPPLQKRFAFRKDQTNQIVMYEHQNAAPDVDHRLIVFYF